MLWFVPVKHYIAQSGEFVLCAFGSLHIALNAVKIKRHLTGLVFAGLALAFLINVFYVATSRTQLVVFPCLLVVFGIQRFGLRGAYVALATGAILASLVWFTSPYLRGRVIGVVQAIHHSQAGDPPASADDSLISAAQHLSILKRSIQIIEKAPLIGNAPVRLLSFSGNQPPEKRARGLIAILAMTYFRRCRTSTCVKPRR